MFLGIDVFRWGGVVQACMLKLAHSTGVTEVSSFVTSVTISKNKPWRKSVENRSSIRWDVEGGWRNARYEKVCMPGGDGAI